MIGGPIGGYASLFTQVMDHSHMNVRLKSASNKINDFIVFARDFMMYEWVLYIIIHDRYKLNIFKFLDGT